MDPIESLRQTAAAAGLLPNEDPAIQRLRQTARSAGLLGSRQEDDEPLRKPESTLLKSQFIVQ